MNVTSKMAEFRDRVESEFSALGVVAYWDRVSGDDLDGEVVTFRVLNVPHSSLVDVDRFCYKAAYDSMGFEWDFLIDVRERAESLVGGCYEKDYSRESERLKGAAASIVARGWESLIGLRERPASLLEEFICSNFSGWSLDAGAPIVGAALWPSSIIRTAQNRSLVDVVGDPLGDVVVVDVPRVPTLSHGAGGSDCGRASVANTYYSLAA